MKRIILCNAMPAYFEAIGDRIEHLYPAVEVVYATTHEEAISCVPQTDQCLIITDSVIPGEGVKNQTDGVLFVLEGAKQKNAQCKVFLYAMVFIPIEKKFDFSIDASDINSLSRLFGEIKKFYEH